MNCTNPSVVNVNDLEHNVLSKKYRVADSVVRIMGSWKFIITQTILLLLWSIINIISFFEHWDPYPFILLNLVLSLQAAYAAPIIMMSQNRQTTRDRIEAHNDYLINLKSEKEITTILKHLESQNKMILKLHQLLLAKEQEMTDIHS